MPTRSSTIAVLCLCASLPACSWSRFDDIRNESPVVRITNPGAIPGFGARLASARLDAGSVLLVGGQPNSASSLAQYSIADDRPASSPVDVGFCGQACVSGASLTPLLSAAPSGSTPPCFLFGAGDRAGARGLLGRCQDRVDFVYPVPGADPAHPQDVSPAELVDQALAGDLSQPLIQQAASADQQPLVAAVSSVSRRAWFYPPASSAFQLLPSPDAVATDQGEDFGAAVAVLALAGGDHLVAVSAPRIDDPSRNGHVWFYRIERATNQVSSWGCLPGDRSGFGLYLSAGQLVGDASDELLVTSIDSIQIYDGSVLAAQPLSDQCDAPLASADPHVASLSCVDSAAVVGCNRSPLSFGRSTAIGDLDGDGVNELVVGMPELDVDGVHGAGAVLVYHVDADPTRSSIVETDRLASPSNGDALGSAVATVRVGDRDVVAAGAPGAATVFLFYCSSLGGAGRNSFRCP